MILACAIQAEVNYVVSGDPHLKRLKIYEGIKIVSPVVFLQII